MPEMRSPYVGKPVVVPEGLVADFRAAGFVEVEPEKPVEKKKPAARGKGK